MSAVTWIREDRAIDTVGTPVAPQSLARVPGTLGAGVAVSTSGWIPALIVLGVLGLAVYGIVKAAPPATAAVRRRLGRDELDENPRKVAKRGWAVRVVDPDTRIEFTRSPRATLRAAEEEERNLQAEFPGVQTRIVRAPVYAKRTARARKARRRASRRRPSRRNSRSRRRRR